MKQPIAIKSISNTISIVIFDIVYGVNDCVLSAFNIDGSYIYNKTTRIFYDYNGEPYFYRFSNKYYLKDFISNY